MRRVLIMMLLPAALLPRAASADVTERDVSVFNNSFSPTPAQAAVGDTVTWHWTCSDGSYGGGTSCVTHNVTAYEGVTFASGNQSAQGATFSYTLTNAATIGYRCTIHSTLSGGGCQGMCGAIVNDNQKPTVRIFRPASPLATIGTPSASIVFAGDVKDNRATAAMWLRITPAVGTGWNAPIACAACPKPDQWLWDTMITLEPGLYAVTANARDTVGLEGRSDPITVIVI